jgi:hypothetical protein
MELNVDIDAIVLYGVQRIDRERLAADIAQRLEFHLLTEGLARDSSDVSRFSPGAAGGDVSEARRFSNRRGGDRPSRDAVGGDGFEAGRFSTGVGGDRPSRDAVSGDRLSGGPAEENIHSEARQSSETSPPTAGGSRQSSSGLLSGGSSIADRVADAVWSRLRAGGTAQ